MADDDRKKCKHTICTCTVTDDDDDSCSPHCEAAGDELELACNCGHPGCAAEL